MAPEPSHPYEILDVFTDAPLHGNPLAVFTEGEAVPSRLMQAAARELHLSETVFVLPGDGDADAELRIFTPDAELPFAGHPVLGAAFVVGARHGLSTVRLRTVAGIVPVTLTREQGEIVSGEMQQPIPRIAPYRHTDDLLAALSLDYSPLPIEVYSNGPEHVMVALDTPARVAGLKPNFHALEALGRVGISCFAIDDGEEGDAEGEEEADADPDLLRVRGRVFAAGLGISEDPATGSAAGPLALHLVRHGWAQSGQQIRIVQGVEIHRPSALLARVEGAPEEPERILVGGRAVVVARGEFRLQ